MYIQCIKVQETAVGPRTFKINCTTVYKKTKYKKVYESKIFVFFVCHL